MPDRSWAACLIAPAAALSVGAATASARPTPPAYTFQDLGSLTGLDCDGSDISAEEINDAGQIVGWSRTDECFIHAFLWDPALGMIDLGILPGGDGSAGFGLNSLGHAVGGGSSDTGYRAFLWTPGDGGVIRAYSQPMNNDSSAADINDAGQAAGWIGTDRHAVVWPGGLESAPIDLGVLTGYATSVAHAISGTGVVVGTASDFPFNCEQGFVWDSEGGLRGVGTLGGTCSNARDVNDAGQVVGYAEPEGDGGGRAYRWVQGEEMQDLGVLAVDSEAWGINGGGDVVGASPRGPDGRAFLWTPEGGMVDLNTMIASGAGLDVLSVAYDVDDRGQIVGVGLAGTRHRGFLLTPRCPADWNADAARDSNDFFAFLTDYFAGEADFTGDGQTNSDDFFAFLTVFFEGCA